MLKKLAVKSGFISIVIGAAFVLTRPALATVVTNDQKCDPNTATTQTGCTEACQPYHGTYTNVNPVTGQTVTVGYDWSENVQNVNPNLVTKTCGAGTGKHCCTKSFPCGERHVYKYNDPNGAIQAATGCPPSWDTQRLAVVLAEPGKNKDSCFTGGTATAADGTTVTCD